jgi:hypothetical protein
MPEPWLPHLLSQDGEVIRVLTSEDFLSGPRYGRDQLVVLLDRRAKVSLSVEGFEVSVPSAEAGTHVDEPELLAAALDRLVATGVIDQEAVDDAIEATRIQKPPPRRTATVTREAFGHAPGGAARTRTRAKTAGPLPVTSTFRSGATGTSSTDGCRSRRVSRGERVRLLS